MLQQDFWLRRGCLLSSLMGVAAFVNAGRSLLSGDADTTRPMMEMVRQAVFNMLLARGEGPSHLDLPPDSTWLDLFAGTGAVGLEALSRGCRHASFVELDSWVVDKVLEPNLSTCGLMQQASVHCMVRCPSSPCHVACPVSCMMLPWLAAHWTGSR